jgi:hypothetical protein
VSYAVSSGGTFGVIERHYRTETGVAMVVIRWGTLGWLTPVPWSEVRLLRSLYASEARAEAEEWLASR